MEIHVDSSQMFLQQWYIHTQQLKQFFRCWLSQQYMQSSAGFVLWLTSVHYHLSASCLDVRLSDAGRPPSALRSDGTSVLCGVTRVGLVAKGLLIKGDMDLELVLMCREKPTKLLLYTISANLPLQIQVTSARPRTLRIQNEPLKLHRNCDTPPWTELQ